MNNGKIRSYRDLDIWQRSMNIAEMAYRLTRKFPPEERYNMVSQIRRSADSIPANIAEGYRKRGKADKVKYLNISEGSLEECKYYLLLAEDLGYAKTNKENELAEEVSKLLNAYSNKILSSDS